jgi:hypothetical protein
MSTSDSSSAGSDWSRDSTVCAREGAYEVEEMIVLDCEYVLDRPGKRREDSGGESLSNGVCSVGSSARGNEWVGTSR